MKIWSAPFTIGGWRTVAAVLALWLALPVHGGSRLTAIHSFSALSPDGSTLETPLTLGNDGNFYGVASNGGAYDSGTVFTMSPAGAVAVLHPFTGGDDGGTPRGALLQGANGNFYGTTQDGGTNGYGSIFMITPQGDFTPLHSFSGQSDGANPFAGLVLATNGDFYGTTTDGGSHEMGTVFQLTPTGAFSSLYSFRGGTDGAGPLAPLVQGADGQLYGTAAGGGNVSLNDGYGYGAVFKITTGGSITPLYAFTDGNDREMSYAGLVRGMDGSFYGTAIHGTAGYGSVYQVTASGGFNVLHDFSEEDGAGPTGALVQGADGNLYGTTLAGGTNDAGAIFEITTNGAFTPLYSFVNTSDELTPSQRPFAGLVQSTNGILYGVTLGGGNGEGTIFTITTNGAWTNLYSFPGGGGDGAYPRTALLADTNGLLYGTSIEGGTNGAGVVFAITTNGDLSPMYSFTNWTDGANPWGSLAQDTNGNLWGTTSGVDSPLLKPGGAEYGTIFELTTNSVFSTIYTFKDGGDGGSPHAGVIRGVDGNFYGTADLGGSGHGTIFRITPAGGFTNLHSFNGTSDGGNPWAALVQANDTNFYGTTTGGTIFKITPGGAFSVIHTISGGSIYGALIQGADGNLYGTSTQGNGTVFRITLPNTFTNLYSFTNGIDGAAPVAGLVQASDGNFYGTTSAGGLNGNGTIFKITAGGNFQPLYSFSATDELGLNQDGVSPAASLVQAADGSFYGVAEYGGQFGTGTIFRLTITPPAPPQFLSAAESAGTFNFTWSAEAGAQYQLQYSTNLAQTNWMNLGASMSTIGSTLSESDVSPTDAQRFYCIVLMP